METRASSVGALEENLLPGRYPTRKAMLYNLAG